MSAKKLSPDKKLRDRIVVDSCLTIHTILILPSRMKNAEIREWNRMKYFLFLITKSGESVWS